MAKVFFAPISLAGGLLAGFAAQKVFSQIWGLIDEEEPPDGSIRRASWVKLLLAAALQGAVFRMVKAAADRGSRHAFATVTGTWPGEEEPEAE
jgi:Protein of unknown function (DUF4235)